MIIGRGFGYLFMKPINAISPSTFDFIFIRKTKILLPKINQYITHRDFGPDSRSVARTSLRKEPSTILWLDTFEKNSNLLDIGASVGVFSIYAAKVKKCSVVSLEPNTTAFNLLCLNVYDNHLNEKITPYPLAASSSEGFSKVFMNVFSVDAGGANFGAPIDPRGETYKPSFSQGTYSIQIDSLLTNHSNFEYIKMDTDGNELEILKGMQNILTSKELKSILIELNENSLDYIEIISLIESNDFEIDNDLTMKSYISTKRGAKIYNHIFNKKNNFLLIQ